MHERSDFGPPFGGLFFGCGGGVAPLNPVGYQVYSDKHPLNPCDRGNNPQMR
jgi:hypothetical protein